MIVQGVVHCFDKKNSYNTLYPEHKQIIDNCINTMNEQKKN